MISNDEANKLYNDKNSTIKNSITDFNGYFSSELLAPAGSRDCFYAAINAGADAVYMGGNLFGARAFADNPGEDELLELIDYAHLHNKKLFLTVNTLLKNKEINELLYNYIKPYYLNGLDAVIVQDFGVLEFLKERFGDLPVHISTQMTVTNTYLPKLLKEYDNVTRIVTARELSLQEINSIYNATGLEIEAFVHGALCYSYSGQCLFSSIAGNRSGNRGRCAQPCRLPYKTSSGTSYILSPKDLMTLELLPEILKAGVYSLKIEGRMKKPEYVASVVSVYRYYLDMLNEKGPESYRVDEKDIEILMDIYNRGNFTSGYFKSHNGSNMMSTERPNHAGTKVLKRTKDGRYTALKNLNVGDLIEVNGDTLNIKIAVKAGSLIDISSIVSSKLNPKRKLPDTIFRTRNNQLINEITDKYINKSKKIAVSGYVEAVKNSPLKLTLTLDDICISIEGDMVSEALNKPVTKDDLREKFNKLGNTPFIYSDLSIKTDDNAFVNMKSCNELRREAFEKLKKTIISKYIRKEKDIYLSSVILEEQQEKDYNYKSVNNSVDGSFNVLVSNEEQLRAVLEKSNYINCIYIDLNYYDFKKLSASIKLCKAKEIPVFLGLPYIFRKNVEDVINSIREVLETADGYLIRTLEEYGFLKDNGFKNADKSVMDYGIYNYNNYSEKFLNKLNPVRKTLSLELDFHELKEHTVDNSELMIYGYFPLMLSAQCTNKTLNHCRFGKQEEGIDSYNVLTDRIGNSFKEMSLCKYCYSVIYNNKPLSLLNVKDKVNIINPTYKRLNFVFEDYYEVCSVLNNFIDIYINGKSIDLMDFDSNKYTKGHFVRKTE